MRKEVKERKEKEKEGGGVVGMLNCNINSYNSRIAGPKLKR
jgi:hypothetical protein